MEAFGLVVAALSIYFGYIAAPLYWLIPCVIVGALIYLKMRHNVILGDIQRHGVIMVLINIIIPQFITWAAFYGIGYGIAYLIN